MSTMTPKASEKEVATSRTPRTWLIVLGVVLVVAVLAVGTWAIIDTSQSVDVTAATEVADEWTAAWEADDGEAVAALFVEDGVYKDPSGTLRGRDAIAADVEAYGPQASNHLRTSELTETDTGTFTYMAQYDWQGGAQGGTWAGEIELEFEGDLMAQAEWLYWSKVSG